MKYLIDAYNLIGRCNSLSLSHKEKHYQLVNFLNTHACQKQTYQLIFDGQSEVLNFGRHETYHGIDLYFTEYGQTADDYIISVCEALANKKSWVVVSSDKEIQTNVASLNGDWLSSEQFLKRVTVSNKHESKPDPSEWDTEYWLTQF